MTISDLLGLGNSRGQMSSQTGSSASPGPFTPLTPSSTQSSMSPGAFMSSAKTHDYGFQVIFLFLNIFYSCFLYLT